MPFEFIKTSTINYITTHLDLKINRILIKDFRQLKNLEINDLDPHINLFIGINGAGKSSILDAMSIIFSWFVKRIYSSSGKGKEISKEDINISSKEGCVIEIDTGKWGEWKLYRSRTYQKYDKTDFSRMSFFIKNIRSLYDEDKAYSIPIVVHYGVNRSVPRNPLKINKSHDYLNQLDVYRNSLNANLLFPDFFNWFKQEEDLENEKRIDNPEYRSKALEFVRKAILKAMPGYNELRISRKPLGLYLQKQDKKLKINQLSDGEKGYIVLIGDISRRLILANPGLDDPLKGNGIVMIDEVDLHLHPQWQLTIVSNLTAIFPNIQFFLSSHSPIVASDVHGKVFSLINGNVELEKTYGKTSSQILSAPFNMEMQRSPTVNKIIEDALSSLKNNDMDSFESNLQSLKNILGVNDIEIGRLNIEKIRKENQNAHNK